MSFLPWIQFEVVFNNWVFLLLFGFFTLLFVRQILVIVFVFIFWLKLRLLLFISCYLTLTFIANFLFISLIFFFFINRWKVSATSLIRNNEPMKDLLKVFIYVIKYNFILVFVNLDLFEIFILLVLILLQVC